MTKERKELFEKVLDGAQAGQVVRTGEVMFMKLSKSDVFLDLNTAESVNANEILEEAEKSAGFSWSTDLEAAFFNKLSRDPKRVKALIKEVFSEAESYIIDQDFEDAEDLDELREASLKLAQYFSLSKGVTP